MGGRSGSPVSKRCKSPVGPYGANGLVETEGVRGASKFGANSQRVQLTYTVETAWFVNMF